MDTRPLSLDDGLEGLTSGGRGEGILWIHGYTMDSSLWTPLWRRLSDWRHVGVDLPGHGRSRGLRPSDNLPDVARVLSRAAQRLDVRHVVGLSFGTMIALEIVLQNPKAYKTLTLGAPIMGGGPPDSKAQTRNMELMRLYKERGAGIWMTELWMSSPPDIFKGAAAQPELFGRIRGVVDRHRWSELDGRLMERFVSHEHAPRQFSDVEADALILVGEQDMPTFLRSAHVISGILPRCRVSYLPEVGHLCLLEAPDAVTEAMRRHLTARDGGGSA